MPIVLPTELSGPALARFKFYAPFVKSLDTSRDRNLSCVISNPEGLYELSQRDPLLPNLQYLKFSVLSRAIDYGFPRLLLLLMFLSKSLLEYRIRFEAYRPLPAISLQRFSAVLAKLEEHCPNIQTLELYPDGRVKHTVEQISSIRLHYEPLSYFKANTLQSLSTCLSVLQDLGDLQCISHLRSLTLHCSESLTVDEPLPNFEGNKWPNLTHLSLFALPDPRILLQLWSNPRLVRRLTAVVIVLLPIGIPYNMGGTTESFLDMLIEQSPGITDLSVIRRPSSVDIIFDPAPLIGFLSRAVLRSLGIEIGKLLSYRDDYFDLKKCLSGRSYTHLVALALGHCRFKLDDLQYLAQAMPRLRHLRTQLFIPPGEIKLHIDETTQRRACRMELRVCYVVTSGADWDHVSKYLLSVWPKLTLSLRPSVEQMHGEWMGSFEKAQREHVCRPEIEANA
ncbi:hypothetical protein RhiJN_05293 [Ceratobasidium sp. AG-Ba]|nr:hypothetical protein RhiJN_05293 [Ceratobasidium sp. AG-Ba]